MPLGVCSANESTWLAKLPSTWWLLPCTSAAIAPPTVTWRVPGVTCTNQPSGHHRAHDRVEAHPGVDADDALLDVDLVEPGEGGGVEHRAAGVLGGVAVAAAEAAGDQPPAARARQSGVDVAARRAARRASPRSARCGSTRSASSDARRPGIVRRRAQPRTPKRERHHPDQADDLEHPVGEDDLLGRAAAALVDDAARSAAPRSRTARSRAGTRSRRPCAPRSRTPRGSTR